MRNKTDTFQLTFIESTHVCVLCIYLYTLFTQTETHAIHIHKQTHGEAHEIVSPKSGTPWLRFTAERWISPISADLPSYVVRFALLSSSAMGRRTVNDFILILSQKEYILFMKLPVGFIFLVQNV